LPFDTAEDEDEGNKSREEEEDKEGAIETFPPLLLSSSSSSSSSSSTHNHDNNHIRYDMDDNNNQQQHQLLKYKEKCLLYLTQYTSRLIAESKRSVNLQQLEFTGSMDSELNGFLTTFNDITVYQQQQSQQQSQQSQPQIIIPDALLSQSYDAVTRLKAHRSTRISALQSKQKYL